MQTTLFGSSEPTVDASLARTRRRSLSHGAWVDHCPGWLTGHERLLEELAAGLTWRTGRREMYGRVVDVPRLVARLPDDGPVPAVIQAASEALSARYARGLHRVSAALYRHGHHSVAWHGDRMGALKHDTVVAVISLGEPRRFLLRPKGGGPSLAFQLGCGDLLVMGGTCQATWDHCVPKVAHVHGPRLSVMVREAVPGPPPVHPAGLRGVGAPGRSGFPAPPAPRIR